MSLGLNEMNNPQKTDMGSVTALVFCVNLYKNGKTPVASILKDLCEMVLN